MTAPNLPALIEEVEKALEPFKLLRDVYPAPRWSISADDTIIFSAGNTQITLADLDAASKALATLRAAAKEAL